ncbi:hypothetical protein OH77DRAFT_247155 [Trametes cingulata]|nr:hypothetical protein OH77DRAFT_247155 [Trametes cingulata]
MEVTQAAENGATAPAQRSASLQYHDRTVQPDQYSPWLNDYTFDPHAQTRNTMDYSVTPYSYSPAFGPYGSHAAADPYQEVFPVQQPESFSAPTPPWLYHDDSSSDMNTAPVSLEGTIPFDADFPPAPYSPTFPLYPVATDAAPQESPPAASQHPRMSLAPPPVTSQAHNPPTSPATPPSQVVPEPPQTSRETPWDFASSNEVYPNSEAPRQRQRRQQQQASRCARAAPSTRRSRARPGQASDGPVAASPLTRSDSYSAGTSTDNGEAQAAPRPVKLESSPPPETTSNRKCDVKVEQDGEDGEDGEKEENGTDAKMPKKTKNKKEKLKEGEHLCPVEEDSGDDEMCPKTFDRPFDADRHATYEHLGITLGCYAPHHDRPVIYSRPDGTPRHLKSSKCLHKLYEQRLRDVARRLNVRMKDPKAPPRRVGQALAREYVRINLPCWKKDPRRDVLLRRIERLRDSRDSIEKLERYLSKHGVLVHYCDCCVPVQYDERAEEKACEIEMSQNSPQETWSKMRPREQAIQAAATEQKHENEHGDPESETDPGYESEEDMPLAVATAAQDPAKATEHPQAPLSETSQGLLQADQEDACDTEDEDASQSQYEDFDTDEEEAFWDAVLAAQAQARQSHPAYDHRAAAPDSPDVPLSTLPGPSRTAPGPSLPTTGLSTVTANYAAPGYYDPGEALEVPERRPLADLDFNTLFDDDEELIDYYLRPAWPEWQH